MRQAAERQFKQQIIKEIQTQNPGISPQQLENALRGINWNQVYQQYGQELGRLQQQIGQEDPRFRDAQQRMRNLEDAISTIRARTKGQWQGVSYEGPEADPAGGIITAAYNPGATLSPVGEVVAQNTHAADIKLPPALQAAAQQVATIVGSPQRSLFLPDSTMVNPAVRAAQPVGKLPPSIVA